MNSDFDKFDKVFLLIAIPVVLLIFIGAVTLIGYSFMEFVEANRSLG